MIPEQPAARRSLDIYRGADRESVAAALRRGTPGGAGEACLCLYATDATARGERRQRALAALETAAGIPFRIADGVYFRPQPIGGETAFLFGGAGGAAMGAGRALVAEFPFLLDEIRRRVLLDIPVPSWLLADRDVAAQTEAEHLMANAILTTAHVGFTRCLLGLEPHAAIGLSLGEATALFALEAWDNPLAYFADFDRHGIFAVELGGEFRAVQRSWQCSPQEAGQFQSWRLLAPVDAIRAALTDEPRLHVTTIHTNNDVILGGDGTAVARLLARFPQGKSFRFLTDLAVHCPEAAESAPVWRQMHERKTRMVDGIRFYSHATGRPVAIEAQAIADALTRQVVQTIDFRQVINNAWDDGVRIFVEHGPQAGCSGFISRILGKRPHLAIAMDNGDPRSLDHAFKGVAQLVAAGLPLDLKALGTALSIDGVE